MISTTLNELDPVINLKNLFYELGVDNNLTEKIDDLNNQSKRDNFKLLEEIQTVLQRCTHLTGKQRLMYCESQRYFMKLYLREMNRKGEF
jgi:hypothetical protein